MKKLISIFLVLSLFSCENYNLRQDARKVKELFGGDGEWQITKIETTDSTFLNYGSLRFFNFQKDQSLMDIELKKDGLSDVTEGAFFMYDSKEDKPVGIGSALLWDFDQSLTIRLHQFLKGNSSHLEFGANDNDTYRIYLDRK